MNYTCFKKTVQPWWAVNGRYESRASGTNSSVLLTSNIPLETEEVRSCQGCMNNLTFGDEQMGYYETIAGGAGAGPRWHGRSGVHTHMTNTRITDPEIFERRFPVVLHEFSLREGSGGAGEHRGGDGVIREVYCSADRHTLTSNF